jgi:hypothetical protein
MIVAGMGLGMMRVLCCEPELPHGGGGLWFNHILDAVAARLIARANKPVIVNMRAA